MVLWEAYCPHAKHQATIHPGSPRDPVPPAPDPTFPSIFLIFPWLRGPPDSSSSSSYSTISPSKAVLYLLSSPLPMDG